MTVCVETVFLALFVITTTLTVITPGQSFDSKLILKRRIFKMLVLIFIGEKGLKKHFKEWEK